MRGKRGGASSDPVIAPQEGLFGTEFGVQTDGEKISSNVPEGTDIDGPKIHGAETDVVMDIGAVVVDYFNAVLNQVTKDVNDAEDKEAPTSDAEEIISMEDVMLGFAGFLDGKDGRFSIDYAQMSSDRDAVAAAVEIGAIFVREEDGETEKRGGGVSDDIGVKDIFEYLKLLSSLKTVEEIAIAVDAFEQKVYRRSDMIALDKQCLLPLIRLAITAVAASDAPSNSASDSATDSANHLLVNALIGGISMGRLSPGKSMTENTRPMLVAKLGLPQSHSLAELLILNIVTKKSPKHSLYNASYLYAINKNIDGSKIGWIDEEKERERIIGESTEYIHDIARINSALSTRTPGQYGVFLPLGLLFIDEVVHGALLANRYKMLTTPAFNRAMKIIKEPGFACTLDSFSGILPPSPASYTDNPDDSRLLEMFKIRSRVERKSDAKPRRFNLFYYVAHGQMTHEVNEDTGRNIGMSEDKRHNVTVPANVVMVRKGMIGKKAFGVTMLEYFCKANIPLLASSWEKEGAACDIIPPGHIVQNVWLYGGTPGKEWRRMGFKDCSTNATDILKAGESTYLDDVLQKVSTASENTGYPALLVTAFCQETEDLLQVREGLLANFRALEQLPSKLIYLGHREGLREVDVPLVVQASSELRRASGATPMRSYLAKSLQSLIVASQQKASTLGGGTYSGGAAVNYGLFAVLFIVTVASSLIGAA